MCEYIYIYIHIYIHIDRHRLTGCTYELSSLLFADSRGASPISAPPLADERPSPLRDSLTLGEYGTGALAQEGLRKAGLSADAFLPRGEEAEPVAGATGAGTGGGLWAGSTFGAGEGSPPDVSSGAGGGLAGLAVLPAPPPEEGGDCDGGAEDCGGAPASSKLHQLSSGHEQGTGRTDVDR